MLKRIYGLFVKPKLYPEDFEAYYHRLPDRIQVAWEKDGKFIVGRVNDGKNEFVTQGRNVDEFIEMVNDALITVHDIPVAYVDALKKVRTYTPTPQELAALGNSSVKASSLSLERNQEALRAATA